MTDEEVGESNDLSNRIHKIDTLLNSLTENDRKPNQFDGHVDRGNYRLSESAQSAEAHRRDLKRAGRRIEYASGYRPFAGMIG